MTETEQYLNYNEQQRMFRLHNKPRTRRGWQPVGCMDERTAVAFTDFIRVQYFHRRRGLTAKEARHTIDNLRQFVKFYKDYVIDQSFEITYNSTDKAVPINELI